MVYTSQYTCTQVDNAIGRVIGTTAYSPTDFSGMGRVVLSKNIQNVSGTDKNVLIQDMFYKGDVGSRMPNTNTVFVIQYDYVLGENITIPEGSVLLFDGGKISGAYTMTGSNTAIDANLVRVFGTDTVFAGTWNIKEVYPEWFGAKGDDTTDDTAAFMAMASFVTAMDGCRIFISAKAYRISSSIYMKGNIELVGTGDNSVIHAVSGAGIKIGNVDDVTVLNTTITTGDITISGKTSLGEDVTCTAVSPGTTILTVSDASVFEVNELYVMFDSCDYSFTTTRSYYRHGEIIRIKSIDTSNNTITLYNGLYGTYGTDENFEGYIYESSSRNFTQKFFTGLQGLSHRTLFCKYDFRTVNISNLKLVSDRYVAGGETYSLCLQCVKNSLFTGLNIVNTNGNKVAMNINMAYKSSLTNSRIYSDSNIGSGDFYGLSLISIQHLLVSNSTLSGKDHTISAGGRSSVGAVVNRDFVYDGISVDYLGSNEIVIDVHGLAENYTLRNIDCPTYACDTGGYNCTIENCRFNRIDTTFHCAGLKITNCYCKSIGKLLEYSNPWRNYLEYNMVVDGSTIGDSLTEGTTSLFLDGQKQKYKIDNLIIRNCIISGEVRLRYNMANNIIIDGNEITSDIACLTFSSRRNDIDDTIVIRNNKIISTSDKAISIGYSQDMLGVAQAALGDCMIDNNIIHNNSSADSCLQICSLNKCVVTNNWISQSGTNATKYVFDCIEDNDMLIDRNVIENTSILLQTRVNTLSTYKVVLGQNNIVSKYNYTKSGTGILIVPVGDTNMRPTTLGVNDAGFKYYNTTTNKYEIWNGTTWTGSGGQTYSDVGYSVNVVNNSNSSVSLDGTIPIHVIATTTDITGGITLSANPTEGHSCHVVIVSATGNTAKVTYDSTNRITPNASTLELTIPSSGYVEIDFFTANGKVFVRGV